MSVERIYLARFLTASKRQHADDLLEVAREGGLLALESFWIANEVIKILADYPEIKIFLDSGAYTLVNQECKDIQKYLDDYIDFILKYNDRLLGYVNLDDIGNVEISWENQRYMEGRGVQPIPAYHYGEDFKWLEKCVNEYEYVGIGGVSRGVSPENNKILFDRIFDYIDRKNLSVKLHAFGITRFRFLIGYPWYSVDSTTWLKCASYGRVLLPRYDERRKKFDYLCTPFGISVSDISEIKDDTGHSHYSLVYPPQVVERIEEYFTMIGIDSEKLKLEQAERLRANAYYYERLQKEEGLRAPSKHKDAGMLF